MTVKSWLKFFLNFRNEIWKTHGGTEKHATDQGQSVSDNKEESNIQ